MKRTNIVLDEELVAEAKKATGIKTTREKAICPRCAG